MNENENRTMKQRVIMSNTAVVVTLVSVSMWFSDVQVFFFIMFAFLFSCVFAYIVLA